MPLEFICSQIYFMHYLMSASKHKMGHTESIYLLWIYTCSGFFGCLAVVCVCVCVPWMRRTKKEMENKNREKEAINWSSTRKPFAFVYTFRFFCCFVLLSWINICRFTKPHQTNVTLTISRLTNHLFGTSTSCSNKNPLTFRIQNVKRMHLT